MANKISASINGVPVPTFSSSMDVVGFMKKAIHQSERQHISLEKYFQMYSSPQELKLVAQGLKKIADDYFANPDTKKRIMRIF